MTKGQQIGLVAGIGGGLLVSLLIYRSRQSQRHAVRDTAGLIITASQSSSTSSNQQILDGIHADLYAMTQEGRVQVAKALIAKLVEYSNQGERGQMRGTALVEYVREGFADYPEFLSLVDSEMEKQLVKG